MIGSCVLAELTRRSLFRPYIKLDLSGANIHPRDICTVCANEISGLMNALRAMYGLRRVCMAVPGLLLSASTIHLLNLPSEPAASHLSQGLRDLQTLSTNHQFAARCVNIIRSLATKWNIALPEGAASISAFRQPGQRSWSSPTSSNFWAATIPREASSGDPGSSNSATSNHEPPFPPPTSQQQRHGPVPTYYGDSTMRLDANQMQNPFWTPFPGQTMPVQHQDIVPSMSMGLSAMENPVTQWQAFGSRAGGPMMQHDSREQSTSGRIDESMNYAWQWQ